jgi:hypothetical protein
VGGERGAALGADLHSIVRFLIFFLGVAAGYIWRDYVLRMRHDRARREQKQMLDPSMDAAYRPLGSPRK